MEMYGERKSPVRRHHKKILIAFIFLFIAFGLIYFAFQGSIPLTGRIIGGGVGNGSIDMSASLNMPEQEISISNAERIRLKTSNGGLLFVGDNKIDLNESGKTDIIIDGFEGKLTFIGKKIIELDGEADRVLVNGIPNLASQGKLAVRFNQEVDCQA
ncbi:MAG: hypothetical protein ACP5D2_02820, partial [Candidatus Nanoarchaeia archaeon]